MLSLTCKTFHAIVQHVQKDPTLFDGRIDLVQAPGELMYLSDTLEAHRYKSKLSFKMYKTCVFIKNSLYEGGTKEERTRSREQYHRSVRTWLTTHARHLYMMYDEFEADDQIEHPFDLTLMPQLQELTLYWPTGEETALTDQLPQTMDDGIPICDQPQEQAWQFERVCDVFDTYGPVNAYTEELLYHPRIANQLIQQGISITHVWDVEHDHFDENQRILRFEYFIDSNGDKLKSLNCFREYARPGQNMPMKKIQIGKEDDINLQPATS